MKDLLLRIYIITNIFIVTILAVTILPTLMERVQFIYALTLVIMNSAGIAFIISLRRNVRSKK